MQRSKKNLIARLTAHDRYERGAQIAFIAEALLKMRPTMPRGTPDRHLFDKMAADESRFCFMPVFRMMELAVQHGVSLEDGLEFPRAWEACWRKLIAQRDGTAAIVRPISTLLLEEAHADSAADLAQAHALAEPDSPSRLHELVASGERHQNVIAQLVATCRARLLHRPTATA